MKILEALKIISRKNLIKLIKDKELKDVKEHHYRICKMYHEITVKNLKDLNKMLEV